MSDQTGFSLVEVLLALVIGTIILGAVYMATMAGHQASTGIEQKISVQQDVRAALDIMAMEISMASYNPNKQAQVVWVVPTVNGGACNTPTASPGNKGIQAATANSISVEMDLNAKDIIGDAPNEVITYSFDAVNQRITRSTNCGLPQSFLGDLATTNNTQRNVIVTNQNGIFSYFDGQGSTTNNIPDIRRIDITLQVQAAAPDFKGQTRQMVYSTSVVPRNHALP